MPLLRSSAELLLEQLLANRAVPRLTRQFTIDVGYMPSSGEVRSWESSLPVLMGDLRDAGLDDLEVLVEHRLPLSSKRTDVILCGRHPRTGDPNYLVVELKQWSRAQADPEDVELVRVDAYGDRPVLHPGRQVQNYVDYMVDFVRALDGKPDAVKGAAYLHNAAESGVASLRLRPETEASRLFTADDRGRWLDYLRAQFAPDSGATAADALLSSAVAPSKQLMKLAAQEIQHQEQFVLLDEQEVAYRLVLSAVQQAIRGDHKSVVIVTGGPGSGKSVIALSLLGELYRRRRTAEHATGSKAFTETLRKVAGARNKRVQELFGYFNQFAHDEPNSLDVLILDEAHRLRESSNFRFTPKGKRSTKPQVQELLDVARVPVFLLDEHQVVRPGEVGTVAAIREAAQARGLEVQMVELDAQFRSGGSRLYEEWVLRLLGLVDGGPVDWTGDENYEVRITDSPWEMEEILATRDAEGYGARMSAGFCWPWSDAQRGRTQRLPRCASDHGQQNPALHTRPVTLPASRGGQDLLHLPRAVDHVQFVVLVPGPIHGPHRRAPGAGRPTPRRASSLRPGTAHEFEGRYASSARVQPRESRRPCRSRRNSTTWWRPPAPAPRQQLLHLGPLALGCEAEVAALRRRCASSRMSMSTSSAGRARIG